MLQPKSRAALRTLHPWRRFALNRYPLRRTLCPLSGSGLCSPSPREALLREASLREAEELLRVPRVSNLTPSRPILPPLSLGRLGSLTSPSNPIHSLREGCRTPFPPSSPILDRSLSSRVSLCRGGNRALIRNLFRRGPNKASPFRGDGRLLLRCRRVASLHWSRVASCLSRLSLGASQPSSRSKLLFLRVKAL